jgi:hypothetical protein
MLGAIYNGIYNLNLNDTHICSTGNCEWKRWISSLAVCSKCTDVTDQVTKSCDSSHVDDPADFSGLYLTNGSCDLTTPSGLRVSTLTYFDDYTGNYTSTMVNNSVEALDIFDGMTLLRMATAMARNEHIDSARVSLTASNGSSYTVSECSLQWCLQYDTNVQIINGSIANRDTWLVARRDAADSLFANDPIHLEANPVWNASFAHHPLPSLFKSSEPVPDLNIFINHADTLGIRDYLAEILHTSWIASSFGMSSSIGSISPPILAQTLYASQNVSLMMDNLAASMTKHVRASRNATSVPGQALTDVTFFKVHWGWLSLLVATIGLSIVFLLVVIILSHLSATFLWKSNSLALLFHGLDGWSSTELDATKVATMTRMARTMDGQLKRDSDGLLKIIRT